jgi:hypothetical protein
MTFDAELAQTCALLSGSVDSGRRVAAVPSRVGPRARTRVHKTILPETEKLLPETVVPFKARRSR